MTRATDKDLGELHGKVARVMSGALASFEAAQDAYVKIVERAKATDDDELLPDIPEMPVAPAPLLNVIRQFLSDNKITAAPEDSKDLQELENRLKNNRARRRAVGNVIHLDVDD